MNITKQLQLLFVTLLLGVFAGAAQAADGQLDTSFDIDGVVLTSPVVGVFSEAKGIVRQSDGKLVVVGIVNNDFALARYNTNGSLDTTFDGDGLVQTNINGVDTASTVKQQSDGKLVVAGATNGGMTLVRYNTGGSIDTSFGVSGKVSVSGGWDANNIGLVQSPDNKWLVSWGTSYSGAKLARFTQDGVLDTSFATSGIVSDSTSFYHTISLQSDGKIVVSGCTSGLSCGDFRTARYSSNGALDKTFGTNGFVNTNAGSSGDRVEALAIQPDGKIVVAGTGTDATLVRYNSDGSLDSSFGVGGIVQTVIGAGGEVINAMVLQSDGKILATGYASNGTDNDVVLLRYNNDGSLDTSFDGDGIAILDLGSVEVSNAITQQQDGNVVIAGASGVGVLHQFLVARFEVTALNQNIKNDVDADADSDVMWYDSSTGNVNVWGMQAGLETSWNFIAYWPDTTNVPSLTADIDGDGDSDILWYNATSGNVNAWTMQAGAKTNWTFLGYWPDANVQPVATGDFDGDGDDDILWYNSSTGDVNIWVMQAGAKVNWIYVGYWPATNNKPVLVGDFNGDGTDDILWWNNVSGDVDIWVMQNNAKTNWLYVGTWPDTNNKPVGVGDFNGDGTDDILWWNSTTGDVNNWTMLNSARSSWTYIASWPNANVHIEEIGDFNGDGTADILWRDITSGSVTTWPMLNGVKQTGQYIGTFPGTTNSIKAGL